MKLETILKKKLNLLIVAIITLAIVYFSDDLPELVNLRQTSTPTPTVAEQLATPSATATSAHGGKLVTVVSVVDGDTIKIEGGEVVRYIGMNTPETVAPGRPVECYGKEASVKNKELVLGKTVELEKDFSERDQFGRLLRYIWIGDTMINEQLVREGYAQVSTYPPDVKYETRLLEAQRLAREEEQGLWGSTCPKPTPTPRPIPTYASGSATPIDVVPTP